MENETDELIQKMTKKRTEKIVSKKIKRSSESNAFLFGLKGDARVNFDEKIKQLCAESEDEIVNRLGKMSSVGFCTPCGIQKEVSDAVFMNNFYLFARIQKTYALYL